MMKRLTSIDFWRGIAIFFTALFHFLFTSWDLFSNPNAILSSGKIGLIVIAGIIFVLIHWRGFFLMISAVANFYQMEKAAQSGKSIWGIWGKQIMTGVILILLGKLWVTVFPYWGFIEIWSRTKPIGTITLAQSWADNWDMFFLIEAIESIGLMMIITSFFFIGLHYIKGKYNWIIKVCICYGVGILIIAISPLMQRWLVNVAGTDITTGENFREVTKLVYLDGAWQYDVYFHQWFNNIGDFFANFGIVMKTVSLNWLVGREAPLFPMLGSYFIGAGIAYMITQENPKKSHLRWLCIPSALALIWGAVEFLFLEGGGFLNGASLDLGFHIHPRWFAFVSMGLQAPLILAMFSWIEFNPRLNEKRWLKWTRWIRRFGVFTLTVYFLGILDAITRFSFSVVIPTGVGSEFISRYGLNAAWTWITGAVVMTRWIFWLYVIDKIFKGYPSFEFLLSLIKLPKAGRKRNWRDPINLQGGLWDVEMVTYWRKPETQVTN
jgi:hypothetical protein